MKLRRIIILVSAVAVLVVAAAWAVSYITFLNTGNLLKPEGDIGVYSDSSCTNEVTSINWGDVSLGTTKNYTTYIKNKGTVNVVISLNTTNWNPSNAKDYIQLSWDYDGRVLHPGDVLEVKFFLQAPSESHGITSFTFTAVIAVNV
jgi:archaellum component FlaG (FlaF/FlaG flagellin family)